MKNKSDSRQKTSVSNISRREFVGKCSLYTAGISVIPPLGSKIFGSSVFQPLNTGQKVKIKIICAYPDPDQPNWPNIGYDFEGQIQKFNSLLKKYCPDIEFSTTSTLIGSAEEADKILSNSTDVDGYILYLVGCLWGNLSERLAESGKPMVFVDNLFAGSGEFLTSYARVKRKGLRVIPVSSSNFEDVVKAVRCIETLKKLSHSTILVVGGNPDKKIEETYGTTIKKIEFNEINEAYNNINNNEAKEIADKWISEADKVIEPSTEEIIKSAAMYLAMDKLLQQNGAQAITFNCLGGIYSNQMVTAYPCLGFMQFDNDGLVGACEADQRSTLTKLLMTYLVGRPGFISDPVIDTAKNQIIYAHCISSTKMFGPDEPSNPYHIRNHSEDRKGACNRSLMPLGEETTTIMFDHNKKQVIFHQGISVENVDEDKACRTKLAVEVKGDIYKLLNYWDTWGWHRVTYYGDLKRNIYDISTMLNFKVIEEA